MPGRIAGPESYKGGLNLLPSNKNRLLISALFVIVAEIIDQFVSKISGNSLCAKHNLDDQCWLVDNTNLASPSAVSINNCMAGWEILSGQIVGQFVSINVGAVSIKTAVNVNELHNKKGGKIGEGSET